MISRPWRLFSGDCFENLRFSRKNRRVLRKYLRYMEVRLHIHRRLQYSCPFGASSNPVRLSALFRAKDQRGFKRRGGIDVQRCDISDERSYTFFYQVISEILLTA